MLLAFNLSFAVVSALLMVFCSYKVFQILQLSSYRARGLYNWIKSSKFEFIARFFSLAFFAAVSMLVFVACFSRFGIYKYIGVSFYLVLSSVYIILTMRAPSKTPLKVTPRAARLIFVSFMLFALAGFGLLVLGELFFMNYSLIGVLPLFAPFIVTLAHFIILPFEKLNNYGYKRRAIKALNNMPYLIKIGITGSYGKTTAKNILAKMLSKKYNVCYGVASYNTPMGISKVINNSLDASHNVFIAEMGARNVGDIEELTQIVRPNYGIITAIGNQHLETFGSRQKIINTKFELIENLSVGGLAIFNGDSADTRGMFERTVGDKVITGGEEVTDAFVSYKNVQISSTGTSFELVSGGKAVKVNTVLLGEHIPSLVALCAALCLKVGMNEEEIAEAVSVLEPVEHRLQLINSGDGITVIDDAYNSNTEGAKIAVNVLSSFGGKKIIITPGIVELGEEEQASNAQFGAEIAKVCDVAILVGKLAPIIKQGATDAGMNEDDIYSVNSLTEGVEITKGITGEKVILFENDLPDNY